MEKQTRRKQRATSTTVNDILADLSHNKQDIEHLVVIAMKRDGKYRVYGTPETLLSTSLGLMEMAKFDLLHDTLNDEDD